MMGIDYYQTMMQKSWHDGKDRAYRTDSNTGMILFNCHRPLSKRVLVEWERLCRRFSPHGSVQEAATLMETLPQYERHGVFVRDALMLGQYSLVAQHFPGDSGKSAEYPLSNKEFEANKKVLLNSGLFKWVNAYWKKKRGTTVPITEKWRLSPPNTGWDWQGPPFKVCPMKSSYVGDALHKIGLG